MYTSGSTGQPKGVMVEHGALANFVAWHREAFALGATSRTTMVYSPAFDSSLAELWPALTAGARIAVPDADTRVIAERLAAWLIAERITMTDLPSALVERLIDLRWPADAALATVLSGGDRLRACPPVGCPWLLYNQYGPTETTVTATSRMGRARGQRRARHRAPDRGRDCVRARRSAATGGDRGRGRAVRRRSRGRARLPRASRGDGRALRRRSVREHARGADVSHRGPGAAAARRDAAAGAAGFLKAVLAVERGQVPPTLHFTEPNPHLELDDGPFAVNTDLAGWPGSSPRRAGISSFGIGGTNAHAVVEEAPPIAADAMAPGPHLLVLSARSQGSLDRATGALAAHLASEAVGAEPADVAWTLQVGRQEHALRRFAVCASPASAAAALEDLRTTPAVSARDGVPRLVFMFPGQGGQHVGVARDLYRTQRVFRDALDRASQLAKRALGIDLRPVLYPPGDASLRAADRLAEMEIAQVAVFAIETASAAPTTTSRSPSSRGGSATAPVRSRFAGSRVATSSPAPSAARSCS